MRLQNKKNKFLFFGILLILYAMPIHAYDLVEYFSKDYVDFQDYGYGDWMRKKNKGKNFFSVLLVAHVHRDSPSRIRKKTTEAFEKIYDTLMANNWKYESKQGKKMGLLEVDFESSDVWITISVKEMDDDYRIRALSNYEQRSVRKLEGEIKKIIQKFSF